jgi:hypothetical protein
MGVMQSWDEMRRDAVREDALRRPPSGVVTPIKPVPVRVRAITGNAIAHTATHVLVEWVRYGEHHVRWETMAQVTRI